MNKLFTLVALLTASTISVIAVVKKENTSKKMENTETESMSNGDVSMAEKNPLMLQWVGPYNGVPPFDQVKVEYFKPALEAAMEENLAEIDKIAANPAPPDFEN